MNIHPKNQQCVAITQLSFVNKVAMSTRQTSYGNELKIGVSIDGWSNHHRITFQWFRRIHNKNH